MACENRPPALPGMLIIVSSHYKLNGYLNTNNLAMNAAFSVRIPIVGTVKLADVIGNLADRIAVTFATSMVNGNAKFYISNNWLYIDLSAVVFGNSHGPLSFGLFPLSYVVLLVITRLEIWF
jgi:hypothetical protein